MVLGCNSTKKQNGVIGISTASFCYLTDETGLFFSFAIRFFVLYFFRDDFFSFGLALTMVYLWCPLAKGILIRPTLP